MRKHTRAHLMRLQQLETYVYALIFFDSSLLFKGYFILIRRKNLVRETAASSKTTFGPEEAECKF